MKMTTIKRVPEAVFLLLLLLTPDVTCQDYSNWKTSCDTSGPVTEGERSVITCHFTDSPRNSLSYVYVLFDRADGASQKQEIVLDCTQTLDCTIKEGYHFSSQIGKTVSVVVPVTRQEHMGTYRCQDAWTPESNQKGCQLKVKDAVQPPQKDPSTASDGKTLHDDGQNQAKGTSLSMEWIIVIVLILAIIVVSIVVSIFCFLKHKGGPVKARQGDAYDKDRQQERKGATADRSLEKETTNHLDTLIGIRNIQHAHGAESGSEDQISPMIYNILMNGSQGPAKSQQGDANGQGTEQVGTEGATANPPSETTSLLGPEKTQQDGADGQSTQQVGTEATANPSLETTSFLDTLISIRNILHDHGAAPGSEDEISITIYNEFMNGSQDTLTVIRKILHDHGVESGSDDKIISLIWNVVMNGSQMGYTYQKKRHIRKQNMDTKIVDTVRVTKTPVSVSAQINSGGAAADSETIKQDKKMSSDCDGPLNVSDKYLNASVSKEKEERTSLLQEDSNNCCGNRGYDLQRNRMCTTCDDSGCFDSSQPRRTPHYIGTFDSSTPCRTSLDTGAFDSSTPCRTPHDADTLVMEVASPGTGEKKDQDASSSQNDSLLQRAGKGFWKLWGYNTQQGEGVAEDKKMT